MKKHDIAPGSQSKLHLKVQELIKMIFDVESMKKAMVEFEVQIDFTTPNHEYTANIDQYSFPNFVLKLSPKKKSFTVFGAAPPLSPKMHSDKIDRVGAGFVKFSKIDLWASRLHKIYGFFVACLTYGRFHG